MRSSSLDPGTEIQRNGETYVVDSHGPRGVALRPKGPNVLQVLPDAQFRSELASGEVVIKDMFFGEDVHAAAMLPVPKALSDYPVKVREAVAIRLAFLTAICPTGAMRHPKSLLDEAILEVWSNLPEERRDARPPSKSAFYDWRARWMKSLFSDLALLPRWDKRGRRPEPVAPALKAVLERATEEKYATGERPTIAEVLRYASAEVVKLNRVLPPGAKIPAPTLVQMQRVIDSFDPERLLIRRVGKATAHQRTKVYRAGPGAMRLLERVEIDHTRLNYICVSNDSHVPLGRPWLTVMIDVASRMIVGLWISFHTPNANTVLRVLKQSIRRKDELIAKFNLKGEWPACGVALVMVMDNGSEFHSKALEAAAQDLGMTIIYCPSREPRFKGVVERFNRTVNRDFVHTLPGTTFSNPSERGEYDSEACAVLTIDELRALVYKWVVEQYSVKKHRGINAAPLQRWRELEKVCPPQMPKNVEALDTYLRPVDERTLSKKGIECNSLFYVSPELDELRRRNGLRRRDMKLLVRPDPDDLGAIRVLHPDDDVYFTATCTRPDYAKGMTLEQHKFHRRTAAEKYARLDLVSGLLASKQEVRETVEAILKQGRRGKNKEGDSEATETGETKGRLPKRGNDADHSHGRKAGAMKGVTKKARQLVDEMASQALVQDDEPVGLEAPSSFDLEGDDFESYDAIEAFSEREPELF